MYKVIMERQCGCFKKSSYEAEQSFNDKDDALIEANTMATKMNDEFCSKHVFNVIEDGEAFVIQMKMNG